MYQAIIETIIFPALFGSILLFIEAGRRIRFHQSGRSSETHGTGVEVVEGAVFGLMGLLIAFTFSGAALRFDTRRQLVVEEANCIGTAYLRIDLLPADRQQPVREMFRQYTDARMEMYRLLPDVDAARSAFARSSQIQGAIWKESLQAVRVTSDVRPSMLFIPALNAMFDIATTRYMAAQFHTPIPLLLLLIVLTWFCALLAGFRMAGDLSRKWVHMLVFAALLSLTIYVIIDYEYPRVGLVHLEAYDQVLLDLRASMQ